MPLEPRMKNKSMGVLEYGCQVSGLTQEETHGPGQSRLEDSNSDQSGLRELARAISVGQMNRKIDLRHYSNILPPPIPHTLPVQAMTNPS